LKGHFISAPSEKKKEKKRTKRKDIDVLIKNLKAKERGEGPLSFSI
jgi:Holliday junction resolvase RusA-like endonuclease